MTTIAVVTTIDSHERARAIAEELVERKLAACVQISTIASVYTWEGAVQNQTEYRLLAKTTEDRYADVESAIRELHSYDLPPILALSTSRVFEPFAEWVAENAAGGAN